MGFVVLGIGLFGLLFTLAMDTSVATGDLGMRVINIGLMNDKQNLLIFFAVVCIVGALFAAIGWNHTPGQDAIEPARNNDGKIGTATAPQSLFDGRRDISLPGYQLFLTKRFGIEKNNTLDKFVIGSDVFDDLSAVLADADVRYGYQLDELLRLEREAQVLEKSRMEMADREQKQRQEFDARVDEAAVASKESFRKAIPWLIGIAGVACVVAAVAAGFMIRQQSIEEEATRLAWQSAGKVIQDCSECPEMVTIPAGSFEMGSSSSRSSTEQPQHKVKLPGFLLGRTEVTQGQWRAVMGDNPSFFKGCGDDCPVENLRWNDAQLFADKLSQKTGKTYRLPSEAEWEYAARAGGKGEWGFGDDVSQLGAHAWFRANSERTHPVGQMKASAIGLHDMHGNVWEWVQDNWHSDYKGAPSDGSAWLSGGDPARRVVRGGAWDINPPYLRSANRIRVEPDDRVYGPGLRIARDL